MRHDPRALRRRAGSSAGLLLLLAGGAAAFEYWRRHRQARAAEIPRLPPPEWGRRDDPWLDLPESRGAGAPGAVRDAGPEAMRDPPRHWDRQDEAEDESFPASDPPATY